MPNSDLVQKMERPVFILGIDPGRRSIGYGVIKRSKNGKLAMVKCGVLSANDKAFSFNSISRNLEALVKRWRPVVVGIERLRFAKNEKTALGVAETIGVVKQVLEKTNIKVREFAPAQIKLAVTGFGKAGKQDVARMLALILGENVAYETHHASDALAVAVTAERFLHLVD